MWIEKPVGLTTADAAVVAEAAQKAGIQATVGFNYRNVPAVERARTMIADGYLGTIIHAHVQFLSDYAATPEGALTWRYQRARGDSGVLGALA